MVRSRHPWVPMCCWFSGKGREPPLDISVGKNGQHFPNGEHFLFFSRKRTIPPPNKFEKIYLIRFSFWRVIKHMNILKIWGVFPSEWPWNNFFFLQQISLCRKLVFWSTQIMRDFLKWIHLWLNYYDGLKRREIWFNFICIV